MTKGTYIDGFVMSIPKKNTAKYKKLAREALAVFSKDRPVFSFSGASSLPFDILAQRRTDQRRAASASLR